VRRRKTHVRGRRRALHFGRPAHALISHPTKAHSPRVPSSWVPRSSPVQLPWCREAAIAAPQRRRLPQSRHQRRQMAAIDRAELAIDERRLAPLSVSRCRATRRRQQTVRQWTLSYSLSPWSPHPSENILRAVTLSSAEASVYGAETCSAEGRQIPMSKGGDVKVDFLRFH
jgi:hypothetical protein